MHFSAAGTLVGKHGVGAGGGGGRGGGSLPPSLKRSIDLMFSKQYTLFFFEVSTPGIPNFGRGLESIHEGAWERGKGKRERENGKISR